MIDTKNEMSLLAFEESRITLESEIQDLKVRGTEIDVLLTRKSKEIQEINTRMKNSKGLDPKEVQSMKTRAEILTAETVTHAAAKKDIQWDLEMLYASLSAVADAEGKAYAGLKRSGKESVSELKGAIQQLYSAIAPLENLSLYHHVKDQAVPIYDVWLKLQQTVRQEARDTFSKQYTEVLRILNNLNFFTYGDPAQWSAFLTSVEKDIISALVLAVCNAMDPLVHMSTGKSHVEAFSLQMKLSLSKRVSFHPLEADIPKIFQSCLTEMLAVFGGFQHLHTAIHMPVPCTQHVSLKEHVEAHPDVQSRLKPIVEAASKERDRVADYVLNFEDEFQKTWTEDISSWDLVQCGMTVTKLEFHWHRFHNLSLVLIDCSSIKECLVTQLRTRYDELRMIASASRYDDDDGPSMSAALRAHREELLKFYKFSNKPFVNPLLENPPIVNTTKEAPREEQPPAVIMPPPLLQSQTMSTPRQPFDMERDKAAVVEAAEAARRAREADARAQRLRQEKEEEEKRRIAKEREMARLVELERQMQALEARKAQEAAELQKIREAEEVLRIRREKEREQQRELQQQQQQQQKVEQQSPPTIKPYLAERPSTVSSSRDVLPPERGTMRGPLLNDHGNPAGLSTDKHHLFEPPVQDPALLVRPQTVSSLLEMYRANCLECGIKPNSGLLKLLPKEAGKMVEEINLDLNYIGIKGIQPLLHILKMNKGLKYLNLKDNNLENNEVKSLCTLLSGDAGSQLRVLDLSNNPVSLGGGNALLDLALQQKSLESIILKGTLIQAKVIDKIQDILRQRQ